LNIFDVIRTVVKISLDTDKMRVLATGIKATLKIISKPCPASKSYYLPHRHWQKIFLKEII